MALKPCTVCGTPTRGSRCPAHRPRTGSTRSWRQLRAEILYDAAYCCALCGHAASEVDHITPLAWGGSDHPSNLRSLCHDCHAQQR
jgi:5-methylcytosine-specific restriction protein A